MKTSKVTVLLISILFVVLLSFIMTGCTAPDTAGATTETTNGVIGLILNNDNTPATNTVVKLMIFDYDPAAQNVSDSTAFIDTTDTNGQFGFKRIRPGNYSILARNKKSKTSLLIRDVDVIDDSITEVSSANLKKSGSISIGFNSQGAIDSGSYVYIPGTDIFASVEKKDRIVLDDVPAGLFSEVILHGPVDKKSNILRNGVEIKPESTITIENPLWKYSRKIVLNTTASGADIKDDLYNFPILIRLNNTNFQFDQAGGSDLLFTSNNKRLPMEIERWDDANRMAEIWVKIDTIYGNDAEQSITMYWGNPQAAIKWNSNQVFDTADGFLGVWHLNENSDTVHDATGNGFHGIRFGNLSQSSSVIGYGQAFSGATAYYEIGDAINPGTGNLTLSAWVKRKGTGLQSIFVKSNGGTPSSTYGWTLSFGVLDQLHFFTATDGSSWGSKGAFDFWSDSNAVINDTVSWHYVVAVFNRFSNDSCRCFIDGMDVTGGHNGNVKDVASIVNTLPLRIGSEVDGDYRFIGSLDECVISGVPRSDAWIRLCFINQGASDKFVVFK